MSVKQDSRLLVKAFFFLAIVDTINGFFLNKGIASPIGIILRRLSCWLLVKCCLHCLNLKGCYFYLYLYSIFLTIIILNTDSQIGVTITHLLKFVNVVFIYYAAVVIFKSENISEKKIHTIFYLNSIVLLLNIYVGLLGIGYYAYENNLGCKGFIYAHNEMSGMQAVLFGVSYYFIYDRYASKKMLLLLVNCFLLVAALLVATKAGILLVLLCLILVPWVHMKNGILYSFLRMSKRN